MFKRFLDWIQLKEQLHLIDKRSPLVRERDIWWMSFGENIGSEINGKNKLFSRPGLIIKKLSHGFFMVAPTTTQPHEGTWYVKISYADKNMWACLHQIRTIDYRRLSSQIGQLDMGDFATVKEAFWKLYQ